MQGKAAKRRENATRHAKVPHDNAARFVRFKAPSAIIKLTEVEQKQIESKYQLAYVLRQRTGQGWDVDHCYPLALGGVHHPDNLMVLPASLNRKKNSKADPANPAVFVGFLVSFQYITNGQKQVQHHMEG